MSFTAIFLYSLSFSFRLTPSLTVRLSQFELAVQDGAIYSSDGGASRRNSPARQVDTRRIVSLAQVDVRTNSPKGRVVRQASSPRGEGPT